MNPTRIAWSSSPGFFLPLPFFTRFLHDSRDSTSISDNRIRALLQDDQNRIWIGTLTFGWQPTMEFSALIPDNPMLLPLLLKKRA